MTGGMTSGEDGLVLSGLDGGNPLAFLAALGAFRELSLVWPDRNVKMRWVRRGGAWRPELVMKETQTASEISKILAEHMRCGFAADPTLEDDRDRAQKKYAELRKEIKDLRDEIKKRGLKKKEKEAAEKEELPPLEKKANDARAAWLESLSRVVPFKEMRLGKHLDSSRDEFRETARDIMEGASQKTRERLDMLAAFGSDGCFDEKSLRIQATPFCFATGSGHQYFLDTARQLVGNVTARRIESCLFQQWNHLDEKLSMRWDPIEDRRYALMWDSPTSSNNKALTNWAANLLAYRSLQFFSSMPMQFGLKTTAFQKNRYFVWPIWADALKPDVVRSLLSISTLADVEANAATLRAIGVKATYRAEKLTVGTPPLHKYNFSPAVAVL